jgi:hypothetical protein
MPYDDLIEKHARRAGVDPAWMRHIMRIESGGNANNTTGSYKGLFQLSDKEFKNHGGSGSIYDPEQNTAAAANKLSQEARDFKETYGRDPKLIDLYMIHQQGAGGYAAHMANPDAPAWVNMHLTGEGRSRGVEWAKKAIWGNLPASDKAKYGSVEKVTSRDFVQSWGSRIEGGSPDFSEESQARAKKYKGKPGETTEDDPKTAFLEGKNAKKPSLLGFGDEGIKPVPGVTIPNLVPQFKVNIG